MLLPMRDCIDVMTRAFRALADERALTPNRTSLPVGTQGDTMLLMPAAINGGGESIDTDDGWFGAKVLSIVPGNASSARRTIQGVIVLFNGRYGGVVAIIDAEAITAIRTAAVSALATGLLARPDATRLAVIGSGVQAFSHVAAMAEVRPLREVRVWSPNAEHRAALARRIEAELGIESRADSEACNAVANAGLICAATSANTPVLRSSWIARGSHINAVGAHRPTERELDSATVQQARVFVDHVPAAMAEAGDLLIPIAEGIIASSHVLGGLGDLLGGRVAGRTDEEEITIFKSVGLAIEDIVAAAHVYRLAAAAGVGSPIRLT
jgi:ornithine cyclodeaminase